MRRVLSASLCVCLAPPSAALAAAPQENNEARRHFKQGAALYEDGDLAGARFEMELAYKLSSNPRILYNIAIVRLELHDYAAAKRAFERYLADSNTVGPERRAEVERELAALSSRVGGLDMAVTPVDATVLVDGARVELSDDAQPLVLNLGEHEIEVRADGFAARTVRVEIVGGSEPVELEISLDPVATRPPSPAAVPSNSQRSDPPQQTDVQGGPHDRFRKLTWASAAVSAGAGTGAIIAGSLALGSDRELADARGELPAEADELDRLSSRTQRQALAADILLGLTAAAGVATITFAILTRRSKRQSGRASIGANSARVRVTGPLTVSF